MQTNPFETLNDKIDQLRLVFDTYLIQQKKDGNLKQKFGDKSEVLDIKQASELLHMSESTVRFHKANSKLPFRKPGKRLLFKRDELLAWVDRYKPGPESQTQDFYQNMLEIRKNTRTK